MDITDKNCNKRQRNDDEFLEISDEESSDTESADEESSDKISFEIRKEYVLIVEEKQSPHYHEEVALDVIDGSLEDSLVSPSNMEVDNVEECAKRYTHSMQNHTQARNIVDKPQNSAKKKHADEKKKWSRPFTSYKTCVVPHCTNTTVTTPNKHFFCLPKDNNIRKCWWDVLKIDTPFSSTSIRHCCEDHFDFAKDLENHQRWRMMGAPIRLKKGVVPHRNLSPNLSSSVGSAESGTTPDKTLQESINEVGCGSGTIFSNLNMDVDSIVKNCIKKRKQNTRIATKNTEKGNSKKRQKRDSHVTAVNQKATKQNHQLQADVSNDKNAENVNIKTELSMEISEITVDDNGIEIDEDGPAKPLEINLETCNMLQKARVPLDRDKTQFPQCKNKSDQTINDRNSLQSGKSNPIPNNSVTMGRDKKENISEKVEKQNADNSTQVKKRLRATENKFVKCDKGTQVESDNQYPELNYSDKLIKWTDEVKMKRITKDMKRPMLHMMKMHPTLFLGVSSETYYCIDLMRNRKLRLSQVLITLRKFFLNETFAELSLYFGMDVPKHIMNTAEYLSDFIKALMFSYGDISSPTASEWKSGKQLITSKNSSPVKVIIDSFEIRIDKPIDKTQCYLTWSGKKNCNMIKYLISMTPDGVINYVSDGYVGRKSDAQMFEECGILDRISGTVLALNGFEGLSKTLEDRGIQLIQPKETGDNKCNISTICECARNVIECVRKFQMISYDICVINEISFKFLNNAVVIACGLVNFETQHKLGRRYTYIE